MKKLRLSSVSVFVLCLLPFVQATAVAAQVNLTGRLGTEARLFPSPGAYPGQKDGPQFSVIFEPELAYRSEDRSQQFKLTPFLRTDSIDSNRTHFDLREAYWRRTWNDWQLLAGVSRVFWGVAESRHLVDIINQTDAVEDIDDEVKLGQPMIVFGKQNDWGELNLFILPYFRERTFPGPKGRLRPPLPVSEDADYESGSEEWHPDFALRYSHYLGDWDFGFSYFNGTSREPIFVPARTGSELIAYYELASQLGIDVQYTREAWLWKFEAIARNASSDSFLAAVGGFEFTVYQLAGSPADLGLLFEYHRDNRDNSVAPPTVYDNDAFFGTRLALNDTQDTSLLLGTLIDTQSTTAYAFLEAERRIGESWKLALTARLFIDPDPSDPAYAFRNDDFLNISLTRHF